VKTLRSHTAKIILALFIWAGIGMYLVHPVQAKNSTKLFTSWLETVVKKEHGVDIRQQIYRLKESDGSLSALIEKASEMVSRNNDEFNLPLAGQSSDANDVYQMLLVEWNSYQTGNGMGKASGPETVKTNLHPPVDKFAYTAHWKSETTGSSITAAPAGGAMPDGTATSHLLEPLSGGMAIGAP